MIIQPKVKDVKYTFVAGNGERVEVSYPSTQVYYLEEEVRQFFAELHISKEMTNRFLDEYHKTGNVDYRTFLETIGACIDKDFWKIYRLDYGMGNEPCQLGGGNAFILSVDEDGDIVLLMHRRSKEAPETFCRYSTVGGGYRNWRYIANDGKVYCACEPSYLTAMRECREESGKPLDCESMVFFNRENATSYPNGQVVDHAESQFYLCWTDYAKLKGYIGSSDEGVTMILKLKELKNAEKYPIFTAQKVSIARLIKQYIG